MTRTLQSKEKDKVLNDREELETQVLVLENQFTQYRLYDARVNLAVIKLVEQYRTSGYTFEQAIEHVGNTTSDKQVLALFSAIIHAPTSKINQIKLAATKIIEGLD